MAQNPEPTVAAWYREFEASAVPPYASDEQRVACRQCFYSGVMAMTSIFLRITREKLSEGEVAKILAGINGELMEFKKENLAAEANGGRKP